VDCQILSVTKLKVGKTLVDPSASSLVNHSYLALSDPILTCTQSPLSTTVAAAFLQTLGAGTQVNALEMFLYASIILNLGASTCAVLCVIILSDVTANSRVILAKKLPLDGRNNYGADSERETLRKFGLGWSWSIAKLVMIHCFIFGTVCTYVGTGIWVRYKCATHIANAVTVALSLVGGASGLVLLLLMTGK
jgi:hypothetical protein